MKVLQINATCGKGSTGKICEAISKVLFDNGIDNRIAYSLGTSEYKYAYKFSDEKLIKKYSIIDHINGKNGFVARSSTKRLISYICDYNPDIIHLHNIHSHDIDIELLFSYLRSSKAKLFWTFHDCWAFTGYCMYFDIDNCLAWKEQCADCPQKKKYSFFFDRSKLLFSKKKYLYSNLHMTIITPSKWLADLTRTSFLKNNDIRTINNGINLSIFKPRPSCFREKNNLETKFIILGVADVWDKRKGLDVFIELSKVLSDRFQIILVGTDNEIDKQLPKRIISVHRTANQEELAELYSTADVFINPTREDNYPTVNMESIACGTQVITFNTGGSPEIIDQLTGWIVDQDDLNSLVEIIHKLPEKNDRTINQCVKYAERFDMNKAYHKYLQLYIV